MKLKLKGVRTSDKLILYLDKTTRNKFSHLMPNFFYVDIDMNKFSLRNKRDKGGKF